MDLLLIGLLAVVLGFMFWSSRRRMQKMKAEQEEKRQHTVPGAKVLLQGGLYGTIVSYDAEDLDAPAHIELAPGVVVEVHSQAILRVVDPIEGEVSEAEYLEAEIDAIEYAEDVAEGELDAPASKPATPAASETQPGDDDKPKA